MKSMLERIAVACTVLSASMLLHASSFPGVDLTDPHAVRTAQARIRDSAGQIRVEISPQKLPPGRYRAQLSEGRSCRVPREKRDTIAESKPFEIAAEGDRQVTVALELPGNMQLSKSIEEKGVVLEVIQDEGVDSACGRIDLWFSPGREIRKWNPN